MKIYRIPENLKTIIFDIDGTLYTSPEYVTEQVDVQLRHYAHLNKITEDEARKMMADYRSDWTKEHGGKKISLGNAFKAFGIDINTSIEWRNMLMKPELFLHRDEELIKSLTELKKDYSLICVTNNPVDAARRTLKAVGIDELIPDIIGLDTCRVSKPNPLILEKAMELTESSSKECLSIGDRYDIDLALPLEMGMGAILVDGAEDLYNLACILHNN